GVKIRHLLVGMIIFLLLIGGLPLGTVIAAENEPGYDLPSDLSVIFPKERIEKAKSHGYEVRYSKYKPSRYHLEYQYSEVGFFDVKKQAQVLYMYFLNNLNN